MIEQVSHLFDTAARRDNWRFRSAVRRAGVVDEIVAEYATNWCNRPVRRGEVLPLQSAVKLPGVTWSIDGDVLVEFFPADRGPGRLVVRDLTLYARIRKQLRTRHIVIEYRNWPGAL